MILQQPFAISPSASASGFSYYSPFTINSGQVPSTQTDFPILLSVTDARFKTVANGGHVQDTQGDDIRPYSDSGITTAITGYEKVFYDGVNGILEMWVKRSSVADNLITYLAYGNPTLTTDASSTTTWSNSFVNVYHVKDGTTLSLVDAVGANNGTNHSATATTGKIDGGVNCASASSQYVDCGTRATDVSTGVTVSAWVNGTSFPNAYNWVFGYNATATTRTACIFVKSTGKVAWYVQASASINVDPGSATLSAGTWYYLTETYNSSAGLKTYVNATNDGTVAANGSAANPNGAAMYIANDPITAGRFFNGAIDEARFSNVARSADWITTEYKNQSAPATFQTLGTEVAL